MKWFGIGYGTTASVLALLNFIGTINISPLIVLINIIMMNVLFIVLSLSLANSE